MACRILAMQGHNDMIYGHVSALTENPDQYWIKGSGIGLEEATEDDMVLIDFEGNTLAGKRKRHNEFPIHSEVYRTNPGIRCVIHTHPTYSTIIASSEQPAPADHQPELRLLSAGDQQVRGIIRSDRHRGARHIRRQTVGRAQDRAAAQSRHRRCGNIHRRSLHPRRLAGTQRQDAGHRRIHGRFLLGHRRRRAAQTKADLPARCDDKFMGILCPDAAKA